MAQGLSQRPALDIALNQNSGGSNEGQRRLTVTKWLQALTTDPIRVGLAPCRKGVAMVDESSPSSARLAAHQDNVTLATGGGGRIAVEFSELGLAR